VNQIFNVNPFLSIIMPCYKGESFIVGSIKKVENEVSLFERNFELIVVIDGFVDKGYEKAKSLESEYKNLRVIGYEKNRGKGYAIRYGLEFTRGEYVAFLDSDLDYHPKALSRFLEIANKEYADLVIGNRRDENSIFIYPFIRKLASWGFNFYVNMLFPELNVKDTQAGIKLMKRETAKKLFNYLKNQEGASSFIFDICLLVVSKRMGLKIIQAPCTFKMKSSTIGTGKNFLKTSYRMGKEVWNFKKKNIYKEFPSEK
jgi:glycosyltransferase involved in cell wall biosynthesis